MHQNYSIALDWPRMLIVELLNFKQAWQYSCANQEDDDENKEQQNVCLCVSNGQEGKKLNIYILWCDARVPTPIDKFVHTHIYKVIIIFFTLFSFLARFCSSTLLHLYEHWIALWNVHTIDKVCGSSTKGTFLSVPFSLYFCWFLPSNWIWLNVVLCIKFEALRKILLQTTWVCKCVRWKETCKNV